MTTHMFNHIRTQLACIRSNVQQARLRGHSPDFAMGQMFTLAGLLAAYDPAMRDEADLMQVLTDLDAVPTYVTPGGEA